MMTTITAKPQDLVTKAPKMRKFVDRNFNANLGSYRETTEWSTAWDVEARRAVRVPPGSAVSITSGGFESGLSATAVRGSLIVGGKETKIAYLA